MNIVLPVSSHPWRCISEGGVHCPWLRTARFGAIWCCKLFSEQADRGQWVPLETRGGPLGCLEKHPDCIAATEKAKP